MSIAAAALDHAPASAPAPTETPAIETPSDPRFELISKLERKVKTREQELSARQKELEEKAQRYGKYEEVEGIIKTNPLQALKQMGWDGDMETLNRWAMENLGEDELDPVAKRFKEIESTMSAKEKEWEEKLAKAIEAKEQEISQKQNEYQIKEFKQGIKSFLSENKDTFELLAAQKEADNLVYELIYEDVLRQQQAGKEDITPMKFKSAAEKLENYLDAQLEPLLKSKKIQSRFTKTDSWMDKLAAQSAPATINNDMTPQSSISAEELTQAERMELAIKKLKEGKYPQE
jgi:DNA-binding protein H-NS